MVCVCVCASLTTHPNPQALARDHNQLLQERALNVAFQGSSLGHTLLPETEHLHNLTVDVVQSFMRECLVGSRMVVSGSGNVDHDALVRSVEQHFGALPAEGNHVLIDNTTRSLYRGGHFYEEVFLSLPLSLLSPSLLFLLSLFLNECDALFAALTVEVCVQTLDVPHNPEHLPPLTHMMLLFPGFSWTQEECYAQHVLFVLLGGGNSFSSGGPGKGMYSR